MKKCFITIIFEICKSNLNIKVKKIIIGRIK